MTSSSSRGGRGRGGGARGGGTVGDSYRSRPSWRGGGGGAGAGGYGRGGGNAGSGAQGGQYVPGSAGASGARRMSNSGAAPMRGKDDKGKGFQTDMDISAAPRGGERELKPWTPDADHGPNGSTSNGGRVQVESERDILTFGAKPSNVPWDQFGDNERLFGVTTDYHEEIYTTKLDRSGPGYKKRERDADRMAAEMLAKPSANSHIAEERGQVSANEKDEEEKYSGVVRNPNAYVPPGARKGAAAGLPLRKDNKKDDAAAVAKEDNKEAKKDEPKKEEVKPKENNIPLPLPMVPPPVEIKSVTPPPPGRHERSSADPAVDPAIASLGPGPAAATMTRSTSSAPREQANGGSDTKPAAPHPVPIGAVVDQARQFVETERERAAAQKQSMAKNERANILAELKTWNSKFVIPLALPKDILPILSKDEQKQKAIEAKAEKDRLDAHKKQVATKSPAASPSKAMLSTPEAAPSAKVPSTHPRKIAMKIPEIPPYRPKVAPAVPVPIPETASQNIALVTSPTPSNASIASGAAKHLNPNASAFVFKPNANAPAFKPSGSSGGGGESSAVTSPASQPSKLPAPSTPKEAPKNPFYPNGPPKRIAVNMRDDFNPFKHGQVPLASTVAPHWGYTGRRASVAFSGPIMHPMMSPQLGGGGFDGGASGGNDDPQSPHAQHVGPPPNMQSIPPNLMPFYPYRPGVPPQMQQPGMPMMYPGPQFMPQQMSSPGHGPQQGGPNMPMYFAANGVPPNAHFIPPQMHFQHGPGRPVPPGQMYYPGQGQMPGGPQAPQMQQQMSYSGHPTPPQPHFQQPLPAQGPPGPSPGPGGFDGSPGQ